MVLSAVAHREGLLFALAMLAAAPAYGQTSTSVQLTREMIGTFNHFEFPNGDLIGMEFTILPFANQKAKGVVKIAEGSLSEIYVVDLTAGKNGGLKFEMPCDICIKNEMAHGTLTFSGREVRVVIQYPKSVGYTSDETLRRGRGFWDRDDADVSGSLTQPDER